MADVGRGLTVGEATRWARSGGRPRAAGAEARLAEGELTVESPDTAEDGRLRKLIEPRLAEVDLPELLIEANVETPSCSSTRSARR